MNVGRAIQAAAEAQSEAQCEALERACEEALVSGTKGVLVTHDIWNRRWTVEVTDEVPYGMIHEVRT